MKKRALMLLVFWISSQPVRAEMTMLPESRDQQFRTFGLFIDNQISGLFIPDGNRVWLALGDQIALAEFKSWYGSPQFVLYANINAGDRLNDSGNTILMETIDIRAGLSYEFSFNSVSRMSVSWMHQSGHTSDDVQDQDIVHPNLGNEQLLIRYIHDFQDRFRVGGTLKPYLGSDPGIKKYASDQFAEWFPWGTASRPSEATPFVAAGLEQFGADKVRMTYHAQAGVYFGNHLEPRYQPNVRFVGGYYNGVDPRFKYAQFKNGLSRFYYLGAQLGL